jgi:hypothetical protein
VPKANSRRHRVIIDNNVIAAMVAHSGYLPTEHLTNSFVETSLASP